jgi:hypothetical protein
VIDQDYTGEISLLMFNHSKTDVISSRGYIIGQLIFEQFKSPPLIEVSSFLDRSKLFSGHYTRVKEIGKHRYASFSISRRIIIIRYKSSSIARLSSFPFSFLHNLWWQRRT